MIKNPYLQTVRYRAIPVGVSQYLVPRVADGSSALPYSLTVIPLSNTQCTSILKNPYVFSPHTISKFSLLLNSKMIPARPISVKKKMEENVRCYRHFLENTGFADTNTSNGIEPFSYLNHDFCMTWDLTGNHLQHSSSFILTFSTIRRPLSGCSQPQT